MNRAKIQTKINQGYVAAVVVQYAYNTHDRGDIISCHKSYAAAERACTNSHWAVKVLADMLD